MLIQYFPPVKNSRYYTNADKSIKWDARRCLHGGKCLESIIAPIEIPRIVNVPVTDTQFEAMQIQCSLCPSGALGLVSE